MKKTMVILGIVFLSLLIIAIGLTFFINYKTKHITDYKDLEGNIDKQANQFVECGKAVGLVISVVKDGRTFIKGYGSIKKGEQILPDSLSIFELASTSKLFTTAVLQILVDEGVVHLDDKIQLLLNNKVTLPSIAQNTTLLHLATHTSGFPALPDSFLIKMHDPSNPYKDLATQDIYDYLKTCNGKTKEGNFNYSNFGMGLLGHLLELKTGMSFESLVKQKLLNRLGMNHTYIQFDSTSNNSPVQGYDENEEPTPVWTDHVLTGAGSFLSDAKDMIRFIEANLNENNNLISPSLIRTQLPQNNEIALGWILPSLTDKLIGNKNILWHNGMAGGYASFIAIDKTNNYGIIILSNKAVDVTNLGMKLTLRLRSQSWKE